jgi:hypothetical protein
MPSKCIALLPVGIVFLAVKEKEHEKGRRYHQLMAGHYSG